MGLMDMPSAAAQAQATHDRRNREFHESMVYGTNYEKVLENQRARIGSDLENRDFGPQYGDDFVFAIKSSLREDRGVAAIKRGDTGRVQWYICGIEHRSDGKWRYYALSKDETRALTLAELADLLGLTSLWQDKIKGRIPEKEAV